MKWYEVAFQLSRTIEREHIHISFILRKNRLLSIGTNNWKTHPKTQKYGYMYPYLHSELDAYRRIETPPDKLQLLNFRFSKTGKLGLSKPCIYCMPWCTQVFDKITFTNTQGEYQVL